jgi:hypothetical protein
LERARRRRADHFHACGALAAPRAARSTRTLDIRQSAMATKRSETKWYSRPVYWAAAVLFVLFGLSGHDAVFLLPCLVPATLCIVQAHYQWRWLWFAILGLYVAGSIYYGIYLVSDVLAIIQGRQPRILLDAGNSYVFIVFVGLLIGITYLLIISRPNSTPRASDV